MIAVSLGGKTNRKPYLGALRVVDLAYVENPATLDGVSGLVLTGGSDIDPARYNQENQGSESPEKERDEREISLVQDALRRDIPILAICRGMQLLNVAVGGTLTQHIDGHRNPGVPNAHEIEIRGGTRLATILQPGKYTVNSRHHQCVDPDLLERASSFRRQPATSSKRWNCQANRSSSRFSGTRRIVSRARIANFLKRSQAPCVRSLQRHQHKRQQKNHQRGKPERHPIRVQLAEIVNARVP